MGWAGGSEILENVAKAVMPKIPAKDRPAIAKKLVNIFEEADCDTINEVSQRDIAKDYDRRYPEADE